MGGTELMLTDLFLLGPQTPTFTLEIIHWIVIVQMVLRHYFRVTKNTKKINEFTCFPLRGRPFISLSYLTTIPVHSDCIGSALDKKYFFFLELFCPCPWSSDCMSEDFKRCSSLVFMSNCFVFLITFATVVCGKFQNEKEAEPRRWIFTGNKLNSGRCNGGRSSSNCATPQEMNRTEVEKDCIGKINVFQMNGRRPEARRNKAMAFGSGALLLGPHSLSLCLGLLFCFIFFSFPSTKPVRSSSHFYSSEEQSKCANWIAWIFLLGVSNTTFPGFRWLNNKNNIK